MAEEARQGEATTGADQTAIDIEHVDPQALPEELRGMHRSVLTDYRTKTARLAEEKREMEAKVAAYEQLQQDHESTKRQLANYYQANQQWQAWGDQLKPYVQQLQEGRLPAQGYATNAPVDEVDEVAQLRQDYSQQQQQIRDMAAYIQGREQQISNLLSLNDQAWDLRLKNLNNPEFDLSKVIQTAQDKRLANLDDAAALTYREHERQTYAKAEVDAAVEAARKEWELQLQNQQFDASPSGFSSKRPVSRPAEVPRSWPAANRQAAERLAKELGIDSL